MKNGTVNQEMLGTVLHSYKAGKSGRVAQNEALIDGLVAALKEARQKRDTVAGIALRDSLTKLGVFNPI